MASALMRIDRMTDLIEKLNQANEMYYKYDKSVITDKEFDDRYNELLELEKSTGIIMASSPTRKVGGALLETLPVHKHVKPMLSADKTKDIEIIKKFANKRLSYGSWKLDGCFAKNTKITMADGSYKNIQDVQVGDMVKTFDEKTNTITSSNVLNVFNNGKKSIDKWVKVKTSKNPKDVIQVTKNHKFLTPNGWEEIGRLKCGDYIFTNKYSVSQSQLSFLIGGLFGDGHMCIREKSFKDKIDGFEFGYCKVEKEPYVDFFNKFNILFNDFGGNTKKIISGYGSSILKKHTNVIKNLPPELLNTSNFKNNSRLKMNKDTLKYLNPLALAIFYIDDGNKCSTQLDGYDVKNTTPRSVFSLYRYSEEEVSAFSEFLKDCYDIESTFNCYKMKSGKYGYTLTISSKSIYKFYDIVVPYIPKDIRKIKISNIEKYQNMEEVVWWEDFGKYEIQKTKIFDICYLTSNNKKTYEAYDLEINITHNYFVKNCIVHNCTIVAEYNNNELVKAVTRGNGVYGEDVTEQVKCISNIPLKIPYKGSLVVRGECVMSWKEFDRINSELLEQGKEKYSHPRNLAAGTIRQLDTNIVKSRKLSFIVFECVTDLGNEFKFDDFTLLEHLGFTVVDRIMMGVSETIKYFDPRTYIYPVDGVMFEYSSRHYSQSLGATSKFENCRMALKWEDETYETKLLNIEWNTSRTGLINPVAIFEQVDLDGALTTRASLHNVSTIKDLKLGIGDTITVYRANKIIPQIDKNLTKSDTYEIPNICPICGYDAIIKDNDSVLTLHCSNKNGCKAKLINKIEHFSNRSGMDIDGLGESTIERLVDVGILTKIEDIYNEELWKRNKKKIIDMQGFGEVSYENLINSINKSRCTTLSKFLTSLGIPYNSIGNCKKISIHCKGDINTFIELYHSCFNWNKIKDIGNVASKNLEDFINDNYETIMFLIKELSFEIEKEEEVLSKRLSAFTFAITGTLEKISRRDLTKLIQSEGGNVSKKIIKPKTGEMILINNDLNSGNSKNIDAKKMGIKIITEEEFFELIKG